MICFCLQNFLICLLVILSPSVFLDPYPGDGGSGGGGGGGGINDFLKHTFSDSSIICFFILIPKLHLHQLKHSGTFIYTTQRSQKATESTESESNLQTKEITPEILKGLPKIINSASTSTLPNLLQFSCTLRQTTSKHCRRDRER